MQNSDDTRLSVGDPVTVRRGHPLMGIGLVGGLGLLMAALGVALVLLVRAT